MEGIVIIIIFGTDVIEPSQGWQPRFGSNSVCLNSHTLKLRKKILYSVEITYLTFYFIYDISNYWSSKKKRYFLCELIKLNIRGEFSFSENIELDLFGHKIN